MHKRRQRLMSGMKLVGLGALLIVSAMGCIKVTGGGWLQSATDPSGKATFAFHGSCDPDTGIATGQLEYHDHAANVDLHGEVNNLNAGPGCQPPNAGVGEYVGTYSPQPSKLGPGGDFLIRVEDHGEPGPSVGDFIDLQLFDGIYDGYSNSGPIQGGNIQAH